VRLGHISTGLLPMGIKFRKKYFGDVAMKFTHSLKLVSLVMVSLLVYGTITAVYAQGRGRGGGGGRGGGMGGGRGMGGGVSGGLGNASDRSNGRSDRGLGNASERDGSRQECTRS
jgi:hypothetical protein